MGPGGIGTTRGLPTAGLKSLLSYYGAEGPSRAKLASFIRDYLVFDGSAVPDELIDMRYAASLDPEVVANPPLRRPANLRTLWRMDLTRDARLKHLTNPTLILWGRDDKVNRPSGGPLLANLMPSAELVMTSHTGHWMQWERPDLFNRLVTEFLSPVPIWLCHEPFDSCVFGKVHLGYLVIETNRFSDWKRFGRDAIGMHLDDALPDVMRFRLDDNECRFLLQRGPAEDTTALGWEIDDHNTFEVIESRIKSHGVPISRGSEEGCRAPRSGAVRPIPRPQRTGTGDVRQRTHDLGSVAARRPWRIRHRCRRHGPRGHRYQEPAPDARLLQHRLRRTTDGLHRRDHQRGQIQDPLPAGQRTHHTVAIAAVKRLPLNPIRTRIQHCNIQVAELDDMLRSPTSG